MSLTKYHLLRGDMMLIATALLVYVTAGSSTPWQVVEEVSETLNLPVVYQWTGESEVASVTIANESGFEVIQRIAAAVDHRAIEKDSTVVLRANYVPGSIRTYDMLRAWSTAQKRPIGKFWTEDGERISIRLKPGETISYRELTAEGLLDATAIPYCFLDHRFVVSSGPMQRATLFDAMAQCLGGRYDQSQKRVVLDPVSFRKIRSEQAKEVLARERGERNLNILTAAIEIEVLKLIDDRAIAELFSSPNRQLMMECKDKPLRSAVSALMQFASGLHSAATMEKMGISADMLIFARATGNGFLAVRRFFPMGSIGGFRVTLRERRSCGWLSLSPPGRSR